MLEPLPNMHEALISVPQKRRMKERRQEEEREREEGKKKRE